MKILQTSEAPQALLQLILTEYQGLSTIQEVILLGETGEPFRELYPGKLGVYVPSTESIIIDMKECLKNQQWMQQGMNFVANVWCNLIYTIFHEGAHAEQMLTEDIVFDEATWDIQHEILDHKADITAKEKMIDWFEDHKDVPPIEELGWIGKHIQKLFNHIYSERPDFINEEMDLWGIGMPAERAAQSPNLKGDIGMLKNVPQIYKDAPEAVRLIDAIDSGNVGTIVKGRPCLRIGETLELLANTNRS